MSWVVVVNERVDQLARGIQDLVDRWRYGDRYRQYVLNSHRYAARAVPGILAPHALELDEIFVDAQLVFHTADSPSQGGADSATHDARSRTLQEFLDRDKRVVLAIIGAPGSGKTTLLRHAARRAARDRRGRSGARRNIPILLTLRDCANRIARRPTLSLPELLEESLRDLGAPDGWWEASLRRGNALVLLDGLDEVALDEDLTQVVRWIEHQIEMYQDNHYVITSRPRGYPTATIRAADVTRLQPFHGRADRAFRARVVPGRRAARRARRSHRCPPPRRRARARAARRARRRAARSRRAGT